MRLIVVSLIINFSQLAFASMSQLQETRTFTKDGFFVNELMFDKPLEGSDYTVDFINETVQINIPGANIKDKKRFQSVKDGFVKNLYTYQVDEDLLRHRIILNSGKIASNYGNHLKIESDGNKISVKIPTKLKVDSSLKSLIKELPSKTSESNRSISSTEQEEIENSIAEEEEMKRLVLSSSKIAAVTSKPSKSSLRVDKVQGISNGKKSADLSEEEIPVLVQKAKVTKEKPSYLRFFLSFIIVGILGIGVFFGLRQYKHKGLIKNKHTSIKMLTQHYLGPKKSLAIVQVAGESILVGITDHTISHIKTLSLLDEEVPEVAGTSFSTKLENESLKSEDSSEEQDEFSIRGIKDLVSSRLSGMRDL